MKIDLLGVPIDALTKEQILEKIVQAFGKNESVFIVTPYSESIVSAQKNPEYRKILQSADIALADGVGVIWAVNYLNSSRSLLGSLLAIIFNPKSILDPIPEKISGSTFIWDLASLAAGRGESIFLLGGFRETPKNVAQKLLQKFPRLKIAGVCNGEVKEDVVDKINASGADYVFVAIGPERQEKWIYENRNKLNSKLMIGLGGTFDYIAEKSPNTPISWRLRGLEWLWRLITQPWRAFRIFKGVFGLIYYSFKARLRYK